MNAASPTIGENYKIQCIFISMFVGAVEASECCVSYYDVDGDYHPYQWCDNYCCGSSLLGLTCCDSSFLQAPVEYREDFCELWWGHHV